MKIKIFLIAFLISLTIYEFLFPDKKQEKKERKGKGKLKIRFCIIWITFVILIMALTCIFNMLILELAHNIFYAPKFDVVTITLVTLLLSTLFSSINLNLKILEFSDEIDKFIGEL